MVRWEQGQVTAASGAVRPRHHKEANGRREVGAGAVCGGWGRCMQGPLSCSSGRSYPGFGALPCPVCTRWHGCPATRATCQLPTPTHWQRTVQPHTHVSRLRSSASACRDPHPPRHALFDTRTHTTLVHMPTRLTSWLRTSASACRSLTDHDTPPAANCQGRGAQEEMQAVKREEGGKRCMCTSAEARKHAEEREKLFKGCEKRGVEALAMHGRLHVKSRFQPQRQH